MIHPPTKKLCVYFIDLFVTQTILTPGTLVNRIVAMGSSPASPIFPVCTNSSQPTDDGLIDSLRSMLYNYNYINHGLTSIF